MATEDWRNGVYLTTREVLAQPDYVLRLRDEIGLDTVVLDSAGLSSVRAAPRGTPMSGCAAKYLPWKNF